MAEPLSPADRSSLAAEQGRVNMTVGGVLLFEDGEGLVHDRVVERLAQRLHLIPRYRQRLAQPAPGVTNPVWVDDDRQGLAIGILSFDGHVSFGLLADRDLDPPLAMVADAVRDALDEAL
jgi:hypothetical protein